MSEQATRDAISDAMDGNTLQPSRESPSMRVPAGNGELLTPTDLGRVTLDPKARSEIEPLFVDRGLDAKGMPNEKEHLAGLRISNPDGSQITVRLDEYKDSTPESRYKLSQTYRDMAATKLGTEAFTENAQYFKEVSWTSTNKSESIPSEGKLGGAMDNKTPKEQFDLIYNQHDAMQEAILKKQPSEQELKSHQLEIGADVDAQNNTPASPNQLSAIRLTELLAKNMTPENQEKFLADMGSRIKNGEPTIALHQEQADKKIDRELG